MRYAIAISVILLATLLALVLTKDRDQVPRHIGTVATLRLDDTELSSELNGKLHFCIFDNDKNDYIYVGTNYGLWSKGEFDLSVDGKKVFTGKLPELDLAYSGVIIPMGDVLERQPDSNIGVEITRVTGWFK